MLRSLFNNFLFFIFCHCKLIEIILPDLFPRDTHNSSVEIYFNYLLDYFDYLTLTFSLSDRKLKNRVAAQTSRDRKKARLDELEETVRTQKERNELLTQECAMLRSQNELLTSQNEWLLSENKRLRNERDVARNTLTDQQPPICSACRTRVDGAVPSLGSAVSPNPLPQGGTAQSALRPTRTPRATVLLKFLTLYFLLKNCSALSKAPMPSDSKSWRRASYEKSAQKLKQILIDQMNK